MSDKEMKFHNWEDIMDEQGRQHEQQPICGATEGHFIVQNMRSIITAMKNSPFLKILMIGFLILLLQIPIALISSTVQERKYRSDNAEKEVASKWGQMQHLIGPFITVPYEREVLRKEKTGDTDYDSDPADQLIGQMLLLSAMKNTQDLEKVAENSLAKTVVEYAIFFPEDLNIHADVGNMFRHRGIFDFPVYRMNLSMDGRFIQPDFTKLDIQPTRILWNQAKLNVLISDTRAITSRAVLSWNAVTLPFEPGGKMFSETNRGIQVDLKDQLTADAFTFSFQLDIQGSTGVYFAPAGKNTEATLESNWGDPSFQGNWLPVEQKIEENDFTATWRVPSIGRNFPQAWSGTADTLPVESVDMFGVDFIVPVDLYSMTERSIKYQFLFLTLTFTTFWLFEVITKRRLHAIQYLLVGAGMCLFYLLELSLAEHIGFLWAYLIAALSIILLITLYCMSILQTPRHSFIIGAFILLLYGYLYTLLVNQDYSLMAGSIGLFFLLGIIMYLTRNIQWHGAASKMTANGDAR
jgi:inner membrane protein